jgi:hypothetical protein
VISKKDLTEIFLNEANIEFNDKTIIQWIWKWWRNPISKTSFQLTTDGHHFLSNVIKLQSYRIKLTCDIKASTKNFLLLDKYLTSPFYIENKSTAVFYGEKDSIMVVLNGYNLQQYLEAFEK